MNPLDLEFICIAPNLQFGSFFGGEGGAEDLACYLKNMRGSRL